MVEGSMRKNDQIMRFVLKYVKLLRKKKKTEPFELYIDAIS